MDDDVLPFPPGALVFKRLVMSAALVGCTLIGVAGPAQSAARTPARLLTADAFQQDCLDAHNTYRARHGVPAMQSDPQIVAFAQKWAAEMARTRKFEHSTADVRLPLHRDGSWGENTFYSMSSAPGQVVSCAEVVKGWYDEIKDYDFNNPGFSQKTGRFTQVVWKSSTKLGCGRATTSAIPGRTETYIVCDYAPLGNLATADLFKENVFPGR
ncbi:CAP family protein [Nonomuraea sp. NPDC005983]|uniref:CAP family protein n=1 Tax=Nonomuraea sp. NPDC005983 TaxID=3155595 RepID=UPI00339EB208